MLNAMRELHPKVKDLSPSTTATSASASTSAHASTPVPPGSDHNHEQQSVGGPDGSSYTLYQLQRLAISNTDGGHHLVDADPQPWRQHSEQQQQQQGGTAAWRKGVQWVTSTALCTMVGIR